MWGVVSPAVALAAVASLLLCTPTSRAGAESATHSGQSAGDLLRRVEHRLYDGHEPAILDLGCGRTEVIRRLKSPEASVMSVLAAGEGRIVSGRVIGLLDRAMCSVVADPGKGWVALCDVVPKPVSPEGFTKALVEAVHEGTFHRVILTSSRPYPVVLGSGRQNSDVTRDWLLTEELCHWSSEGRDVLAWAARKSQERANRLFLVLARARWILPSPANCAAPPELVDPDTPRAKELLDASRSVVDPFRRLARALRSTIGDLDAAPIRSAIAQLRVLRLSASQLKTHESGGWEIDVYALEDGSAFLASVGRKENPYRMFVMGDALGGPAFTVTWGPNPVGPSSSVAMFCSARHDGGDLLAIDPIDKPIANVAGNLRVMLRDVPPPVLDLAARALARRKRGIPPGLEHDLLLPLRENLPRCRDNEPELLLQQAENKQFFASLVPELEASYRAVVHQLDVMAGCSTKLLPERP